MPLTTPKISNEGNTGNSKSCKLPLVTHHNTQEVTLQASNSNMLPPLPFITPDNDYMQYFFEERAAIYQYEGGCMQEEAERLAYNDALIEFHSLHDSTDRNYLKSIGITQPTYEVIHDR